ncbi:MAG TPA: 4a-hydroxytetrahydrobiopterin dehydratase [Candidatus Baltobacteraceae bacterium]|nr:4a-hydroxytetrahydrobiopterin dehydratase [Candidatus Baltobacteraceae bacterium]
MSVLDDEAIERGLASLSGWSRRGNAIEKTYDCGDFDGSLAFVNAVAAAANAADHHPDIGLAWNRVTLRLWSHDAGGITKRDLRLAAQIERIAPEHRK